MRWAIEAVAAFGLLALFTFQVKISSATSLQESAIGVNAADIGFGLDADRAVTYEKSEGELHANDVVEDDEVVEYGGIPIGQIMKSVGEDIDNQVERIAKNFEFVTKEEIEKLQKNIIKARDWGQQLATLLGDSNLGAKAREFVTRTETALRKVDEMIGQKNPNTTSEKPPHVPGSGYPYSDQPGYSLQDGSKLANVLLRDRLKNLDKVVRINIHRALELASAMRDRLVEIRDFALSIAVARKGEFYGAFAERLVAKAEEGLKVINEVIYKEETSKSEKQPLVLVGGYNLQDEPKMDDLLLREKLRSASTEMRINNQIAYKLAHGLASSESSSVVKGRLLKIRDFAQSIADARKGEFFGVYADSLATRAEEGLKMINEVIAKENTSTSEKPSTDTQEDEITSDDGVAVARRRLERLQSRLREELKQLEKRRLPKSFLQRIQVRVDRIRGEASDVADRLRGTEHAAEAIEFVKQVEDVLDDIRHRM